MARLKDALRRFIRGYNKTAVFAVTTRCNCRCIMCDMHKKESQHISLNDAKKILRFLHENKFLIVYFTGGEPTLHPSIVNIIRYSDDLGLVTTMTTNGSVSKNMIRRLKNAGLYLLSVSLDHWSPQICERIRKHKNIMEKQLETIKFSKSIGLKTYALAFLNPFLVRDGVKKLVEYCNNVLEVPFGFCYPTNCDVNSYGLGGALSQTELYRGMDLAVRRILDCKENGYNVANLWVYIKDILNFWKGEVPYFYCKGGEDVIYVDWLGDVYPCFIREKMFNILKEEPKFLEGVKCNDCLINCFREPSVLPQFLSTPNLLALEVLYSLLNRWIYG